METEIIVYREFYGSEIRQMSKCEYFNATDITALYNTHLNKLGKAPKRMENFFVNKQTVDYMTSLCNELNSLGNTKQGNSSVWSKSQHNQLVTANSQIWTPKDLKFVKKGKLNQGTWMHPYLFTDYAMWLSPEFKVEMIIWITDNLLLYRNQSGDNFKLLNIAVDNHLPGRELEPSNKDICINISKMLKAKIQPLNNDWDQATEDQLESRKVFEIKIITVLELGLVKDWDHLKLLINNF